MADEIGSIKFPPDPPTNTPVADPLLRKFGLYLQSYLNAQLSRDWSKIAPGERDVVRAVREASSVRAWFDDKQLPSLFVFRHTQLPQRLGDDLYVDTTELFVLWMPPAVEGDKREKRDPFTARVGIAIRHAVRLGRHPWWVDPGDEDPTAPTQGSVLARRLGLCRVPVVKRIDFEPRIKVTIGEKLQDFDAVLVHIECEELTTFDPSIRGVPSKATIAIQQGSPGGDGDNHAGDNTVIRQYGA
ncbi:MAG TPA: hypothetical protein VG734_25955 [Lacunisphaera sp.]|nr:hypothetical protein [Lacunisphaera sp.]